MGFFSGILGNPLLRMMLASQGKKGQLAIAALTGMEKVIDVAKKEKRGEAKVFDIGLEMAEVASELLPYAGVKVVDDALQERVGMSMGDTVSRVKQLRAGVLNPSANVSRLKQEIRGEVASRLVGLRPGDVEADDDINAELNEAGDVVSASVFGNPGMG